MTLDCIRLRHITLHCVVLQYITLNYITLHVIALHHITLHLITSNDIVLHYIASQHHIVLCYIVTLHCITLHLIALHHITLHLTTKVAYLHYLHGRNIHCHYPTAGCDNVMGPISRFQQCPSQRTSSPASTCDRGERKLTKMAKTHMMLIYVDTG